MGIYSRWILLAALALPAGRPLAAQTLTLRDALGRADHAAWANRIAGAESRAAAARTTAALRGILPAARLEAGWARTDDPVAVFGMALRQRTITAADFNPATLNRPAPRNDVTAGAVVELPLFNADAWLGRRAASRGAGAARAGAAWVREGTRVDVVRAYFGAVLARRKAATLDAAHRAALDHVRAAEVMVAGGLATRSDALLAAVTAGEIEAELAGARADAALARAALAVLLAEPGDTTRALPADLPDEVRVRALAGAGGAPAPRADIAAATLALDAARDDRRRTRALLLPRVNGFGRYDWHDRTGPASGTPMWTVGVMASWSPLTGAAEIAESRGAAGRLAAAEAAAEAARAGAGLDAARRDADLTVGLQRLSIAASAVSHAAEAHRLVARKYVSGLATVVELLDAAATETQARLREAAARHDVIVAAAARLQARGSSLAPLITLDP